MGTFLLYGGGIPFAAVMTPLVVIQSFVVGSASMGGVGWWVWL